MAIPDETGNIENLHIYNGQNVKLLLPPGTNTDNIEYFSIWSIDEELNLGHVILKGIEGVPEANNKRKILADEPFVMRVPKCCPINFVLTIDGCKEKPEFLFLPQFNVYEHNKTHFNNMSVDLATIKFEPYNFALQCKEGK